MGYALWYEIEDGLLDDLERFVERNLATQRALLPQLDRVARSIVEVIDHLHDHAGQLAGSKYGDHEPVAHALALLDAAALALQQVIDSSVVVLVATFGGAASAQSGAGAVG